MGTHHSARRLNLDMLGSCSTPASSLSVAAECQLVPAAPAAAACSKRLQCSMQVFYACFILAYILAGGFVLIFGLLWICKTAFVDLAASTPTASSPASVTGAAVPLAAAYSACEALLMLPLYPHRTGKVEKSKKSDQIHLNAKNAIV